MKKLTLTIKGKIILLAIVGILGLIFSSAMNMVLDKKRGEDIALADYSQEIVQIILKEVLLIRTATKKNQMLEEFSDLHRLALMAVNRIQSLSTDEKIRQTTRVLETSEKQLAEAFHAVTENNKAMDNEKNAGLTAAKEIGDLVQNTINAINQEETALAMEAELLNAATIAYLDETRQVLSIVKSRIIAVQNLFLFEDAPAYSKKITELREQTTKEVRNANTLLSHMTSKEHEDGWTLIETGIAKQDAAEDRVFEEWRKSKELQTSLSAYTEQAQNAAKNILRFSQEKIAERTSIAKITTISSVLATLVLLAGLSFAIVRTTIGPINVVISRLKDIAEGEGDLTKRLDAINKDELGAFAIAFNTFVQKIQDTIIQLTGT